VGKLTVLDVKACGTH